MGFTSFNPSYGLHESALNIRDRARSANPPLAGSRKRRYDGPGNLGGSAMALLRFIDTDGREQDVADIDGLHDLILDGRIGYESLVRDGASGRWVKADDHPLF